MQRAYVVKTSVRLENEKKGETSQEEEKNKRRARDALGVVGFSGRSSLSLYMSRYAPAQRLDCRLVRHDDEDVSP